MIDPSTILAFPASDSVTEIVATVMRCRAIADRPVWTIRSVSAGPGGPDYEQHLVSSFGSSFDWTDEFRFDLHTGDLSSVVLELPEEGELSDTVARSWAGLEPGTGLPTIAQLGLAFGIDRLDLRHLDTDGKYLISAAADMSPADASSLRLQIAMDLDLLFAAGRYCGWILWSPIEHLADASAPGTGTDRADRELLALVRDYLTLVIKPNIDKMNDGDPQISDEIAALAERSSRLAPSPEAMVLSNQIGDLQLTFYPDGR